MLEPSYAELIDVLNKESNGDNEITSRYTIVIAAAKRARQIISGDTTMVEERKGKPLSTAVNELFSNKIKIVPEGEGTVLNFNTQEEFIKEQDEVLDETIANLSTREPISDEEDDDQND